MGRDSISICRTCNVAQDNGYGSYSTWLDEFLTVAEFDVAALIEPEVANMNKNKNVRAFLVAHDGHKVEWTSGDCWYHDDDFHVLDGLDFHPPPHPI